jgi:ligand-binding sensor domain-containing protein
LENISRLKRKYWFGSNGKGIYYLDGNKLKLFTTIDGLVNNAIRGIQEDINGNIYIETPEGISKFDGKQFTTLKAIKSSYNQWKLEPMTCGLVTMQTIYIVMMEILFLN